MYIKFVCIYGNLYIEVVFGVQNCIWSTKLSFYDLFIIIAVCIMLNVCFSQSYPNYDRASLITESLDDVHLICDFYQF